MVKARLLAGTALFSVILGSSVMGQSDESIALGSVRLRIGEPKADVSARLAEFYSMTPMGDSILVSTKEGPPYDFIGSMGFDAAGRLSAVSRSWEPPDQQAGVPTTEALFEALTQVVPSSGNGHWACACALELNEARTPEGFRREIQVTSIGGKRRVSIGVMQLRRQASDTPSITLTEFLKK